MTVAESHPDELNDLTVVLATRNRSQMLRETLEAMSRVRRERLRAEFVVVNNGSADATDMVLREHAATLPLTPLWDPVPGKTHALNTALDRVRLGRIVVFTDDDVTPEPSWFEDILGVCGRWPRHSVFGGRIDPSWPEGMVVPDWARRSYIEVFAFACHRMSESEQRYPEDREPFGPNFWVRREALEGTRFRLGLGPHPTRRTLGDETMLLKDLRAKGFAPIYSPRVRVEHRIEPERLDKRALYRRAVQFGRGLAHTKGAPDAALLGRAPTAWCAKQVLSIVQRAAQLPLDLISLDDATRTERLVRGLAKIARRWEALSLYRGSRRASLQADAPIDPPREYE